MADKIEIEIDLDKHTLSLSTPETSLNQAKEAALELMTALRDNTEAETKEAERVFQPPKEVREPKPPKLTPEQKRQRREMYQVSD